MDTIENELKYYNDYFENKIVFCNCDNPEQSNFWKYFLTNFKMLKLKKLIAINYSPDSCSYRYEADLSKDGIIVVNETRLNGDGDFRSQESINSLLQSDVVVTNPPFSLFRYYVKQLFDYHKNFLILGNQNAVTYKDVFPYIRDNQMWFGVTIHSGDVEFQIPSSYISRSPSFRVDDRGEHYVRVAGIRWFTNIDNEYRHRKFLFPKSYYGHEDEFRFYENYNAIGVNKSIDVPFDYYEPVGVPITFMDKYNPEQFEIVGADEGVFLGASGGLIKPDSKIKKPMIDGKQLYKRLFVKRIKD